MGSLVTSILQYALWPSLTFAMLVLWTFGILDIDRHRRRGTSTSARLLCMAGCVSLAGIFAIAGIGAVFADPWADTVTVADDGYRRDADGFRVPARTPIFSFGLERSSHAPASPAGEHGKGTLR